MARKIELQIIGDPSSLTRATKTGVGDLGRLDDATDNSSSKWDKFSGAAKAAAIGGIGALVAGLKGSVTAARDAEVSQTKMETQLKALGISYQAHAGEIESVIQKTSKLAGLDDEDLQGAFTNIVRTTGDVTESLKLTGLAADFASAKNIDVAKAGELVAKVAGGNTGILSRYGVTLKDGATATEALGAMQETFGGQAEAYGKTAAGAQDRFKVAVENLQESVGAGLLPVLTQLANHFATIVGWLEENKAAAIALGVAVGAMLAAFAVSKVISFAGAIANVVPAVMALNAALLANPIGLVVVALAALVAAFVIAWKNSETFRNIVTGAWDAVKAIVTGATNAIVGTVTGGWNAIRSGTTSAVNAVEDAVTGGWNAVKKATTGAWNAVESAIVSPVRDATEWVVDKLSSLAGSVGRGLVKVKGVISDAGGAIFDVLTWPYEQAFKAIVSIVDRILGLLDRIRDIPGSILDKIGLAQGGTVGRAVGGGGGVFARVGELGPEDVWLPAGAHVTQASQSSGGGGGDIVQHFHGPIGSPRQARIMAAELAYRMRFG